MPSTVPPRRPGDVVRASARLPWSWNATAEERAGDHPATRHLAGPRVALHRAIDVAAPPAVVFRWVCQLRVAPYSYDLIDNFGRRSPTTLTPGADDLALGQSVMVLFRIVDFEVDRHLTCEVRPGLRRLMGPTVFTYGVRPTPDGGSRLTIRIEVGVANVVRRVQATPMAWMDFVMMRKQLLTLKAHAERSARG